MPQEPIRYRQRERRRGPDRRQVDLGPPGGVERREGERRQLPDRRYSHQVAQGANGAQTPAGGAWARTVGALVRFSHRLDDLERRLGLRRDRTA